MKRLKTQQTLNMVTADLINFRISAGVVPMPIRLGTIAARKKAAEQDIFCVVELFVL